MLSSSPPPESLAMSRQAKTLSLSEEEREQLERIDERGSDWRERRRARTVLLFDDGMSIGAMVALQKIHRETVARHRDAWLARSFEGLRDLPRCGAPRKLAETHQEVLCAWAREEACTAPQLRARLSDEHGVQVSVRLVQRALKEKNYVWKRTRHSLRKKRDEEKFRAAQIEIAELVEKSTLGEINLAYVDEAGVAQTPPNRSAWTEKGEVHLTTAERGKRLNVLAALISTGTLFSAMFWETTTAAAFAGFLGLLLQHVGGPLTVILDNASIHKAKAIQPILAHLKQQGLTLYFLPPYSPELNRIELLWHKMKYEWLAFKTRTAEKLEADVGKILDGFGSHCRMTFC
jgi:transposase